MDTYQRLTERFQQIYRLDHAMTYLSWDQMVMMPPKGNASRAEAMAELASIRHSLLSADEVSDWFAEIEAGSAAHTATQETALREMRRVWRAAICLPADLVKARVLAGSRCEHQWRQQRLDNDWDGFLENFRAVVDLSREEASRRMEMSQLASPYEAMLELHCTGDSLALVDSVFATLREHLPELLQRARELTAGTQSAVTGNFPVAEQQALSEKLMRSLGFDFEAGRLDQSVHPFSTGSAGDLRITTRYRTTDFLEALNATAHETGHASYEGGLPEALAGQPVGGHRNMCIHESQSLLFEKQIFLSREFCQYFTPSIHELLPDSSSYDADALWRANTMVEPGLIRVEADEVSYPLHVLLRYEIERDLINGAIEATDIPELWNDKMQSYLGIDTKGNYSEGCMQDIHWTDGGFGYFPSYTLGAVNAAQIRAAIKRSSVDWEGSLASGDVSDIRHWLSENIWQQGCQLESQPLMESATGEHTNPQYYLEHLQARYIDRAY
jgi:carboxypeptidase Taq